MTRYRIYLLGGDGAFIDSIEMNGADDETAIKEMAHYVTQAPRLELWAGRRLVRRTTTPSALAGSPEARTHRG